MEKLSKNNLQIPIFGYSLNFKFKILYYTFQFEFIFYILL